MRHPGPDARDSEAAGRRPVVASRRTTCEGGPARSAVTHTYAVLMFLTAGRSRVEQRGEWTVREGEALLVPAGEAHRTLDSHRSQSWTLAFSAPSFAAHGGVSFLEPFERVRDGAAAVVEIPAARHRFLEALFGELETVGREPRGPGRGLDAIERSLLTLILAEVGRAALPDVAGASAGGVVVGHALRFIERHCLGPLTPRDVAAAVGRSPAYVTAALTRATGRSAGKWIVSGRMAEARRLLLHSPERVDLIAERVGYADVTHFSRMFRREHGVSPTAWRRANARTGPGDAGEA